MLSNYYDSEAADTPNTCLTCLDGTNHELRTAIRNDIPRIVEELDCLLDAVRYLIRTCEKEKLHRETHSLELGLELLLRRRNYILNVSGANKQSPYDRYPCENCYMTYPTSFLMSCLDYLLRRTSDASSDSPDPTFCNQSCSIRFDEGETGDWMYRIDQLNEGVLYPMGAPFVAGPVSGPPGSGCEHHRPTSRILSESDEVELLHDTLRSVSKALRETGGGRLDGCAVIDLAESASDALEARRHFGFDLDCVQDSEVDICRSRLLCVLETFESRTVAETFDKEVCAHEVMPVRSTKEYFPATHL